MAELVMSASVANEAEWNDMCDSLTEQFSHAVIYDSVRWGLMTNPRLRHLPVLDHGDGLPNRVDTKVLARCSDPIVADRITRLLNEAADENTFLGIKEKD